MTFTTSQYFIFFTIISLGTILTRTLPFFIFPEKKGIPTYIRHLADLLPYTIIGLLVVYCLKDISLTHAPYAMPELISISFIVMIHLWKRNTLLSIGGGTLLYMVLSKII